MSIRVIYLIRTAPASLAFNSTCMASDHNRKLWGALVALAVTSLLALPQSSHAQVAQPASGVAVKTASAGLNWSQLTAAQQQALAPLALTWNTGISEPQKRKWLEISKNFNGLAPEVQATLNSRMTQWVALSPQERAQARLNFGKTNELAKQLTPEEKKSQWEAYRALTPEEKQRLAATASPKPAGAATAIKPVAPQKLVTVPMQAASRPALIPPPKPVPAASPVLALPATLPSPPASPLPQR